MIPPRGGERTGDRRKRIAGRVVRFGRRKIRGSIVTGRDEDPARQKRRRGQTSAKCAQRRSLRDGAGRRIEDVARRERRRLVGAADDEHTSVLENGRGVTLSG